MTSDTIGWHFPPTGGGQEDGFNHSGISHFQGDPFVSLARETIQNSLDARIDSSTPVTVSFELSHLSPTEIGGAELEEAIRSCLLLATEDSDSKAMLALKSAMDALTADVRCLRVSDSNTTGLDGKKWRALTKSQGESQKATPGAGGSHGIGKYAPFAVSDLRTVFYWTHYMSSGEGTPVEQFQGKSVLMSHEIDDKMVQGTGFYGVRDGCIELRRDIADTFRNLDRNGRPIQGTSLLIAGFKRVDDWRDRVARSVLENFFHAIHDSSLEALIEPEDGGSDLIEITSQTIGDHFARLGAGDDSGDGNEDGTALRRARDYLGLLDGSVESVDTQDRDLGHCRLWIRVGTDERLPNRVGLVRQTGMLITDQQDGLKRFNSHKPFVAMCVFEDPDGNELLRGMENAQHDQFEPNRLPDGQSEKGRRALERIRRWIRDEVKKKAGPPEGGQSIDLTELNAYLPDIVPEEPFGESGGGEDGQAQERGFHDRVTVRLRPVRRSPLPLPNEDTIDPDDANGNGEGDGEGGGGPSGEHGGDDGTGGSGEGEGQGGTGSGGGRTPARAIDISAVRILPIGGPGHRYRVGFEPHSTAVANLTFEEAGDSSATHLSGISGQNGEALGSVPLVAGKRMYVDITSETPLTDFAVKVSAREAQ